MALEFRTDYRFRSDEKHAHAVLARRVQRALDFRLGRAVRTHRIQRDYARHGVVQLAGFLDFENFASLIVPALGASAMWHFLFVAVGALGKAMALERIVRTPGGGAPLRMTSFWIWHGEFLYRGLVRPIAISIQHSAFSPSSSVLIPRPNTFQNSCSTFTPHPSAYWLNADG